MNMKLFCKVVISSILLSACGATSSSFQNDADIVRLQHLEYYGNLLIEYHEKTGTYPFIGELNVPAYVFVASPEQKDDIGGGPTYDHRVADFKFLVEEFESALGRDIKEYYDPQYEPDKKPNFYIYMVDGNTYNFAVHTNQNYVFSNAVSKGYNKIEITNNTNGSPHLVKPEDLFSSEAFREEVSKPISKPNFFLSRENEFLNATKFNKN